MTILDTFRERRPLGGQDPWVVPHEGALLLVRSARNDRQIVVRRFPGLHDMWRYEETVIWRPDRASDHGRQIWAPELHEIGGRWYVYYSASDGWNANHRMYVLEANHPLGPYHELGKISDPDHDSWAIDLTVLQHESSLYAVWSGWEGPADGFPQNLYIAPMANPWTISGARRLVSTPAFDWETSVAPVNEGPQVIRSPEGRLFIAYSADASWSPAYKMGLLEWLGGDVASPGSWRKRSDPLFLGGGHGCVIETGGAWHLVYHRKLSPDPGWADREIRSEPLNWDSGGRPVVGEANAATRWQSAKPVASSGFGPSPL